MAQPAPLVDFTPVLVMVLKFVIPVAIVGLLVRLLIDWFTRKWGPRRRGR